MAKLQARWLDFDTNLMVGIAGGQTLTLKLPETGAFESTPAGIQVKQNGITPDHLSFMENVLDEWVMTIPGDIDAGGVYSVKNIRPATNDSDPVPFLQLKDMIEAKVAGLDFQKDVLAVLRDATILPDTTSSKSRYVVVDPLQIHTGFGVIEGLSANDVIQYNADTETWYVAYDVSEKGPGALTWVVAEETFYLWDGVDWSSYGGLSGVTAGNGLSKDGHTLHLAVSSSFHFEVVEGHSVLALDTGGVVADHLNAAMFGGAVYRDATSKTLEVHLGNGLVKDEDTHQVGLGELSASWNLGGVYTITGIAEPIVDSDVATKLYVDTQLNEKSSLVVEMFVLTAAQVTDMGVILANVPRHLNSVVLSVRNAPGLAYGYDFTVATVADVSTLSWATLGLDGILIAGDVLTVSFEDSPAVV